LTRDTVGASVRVSVLVFMVFLPSVVLPGWQPATRC
jgi:hypothetical protein